jgi:uncharacterized cupredoxin-like copper-binding protein
MTSGSVRRKASSETTRPSTAATLVSHGDLFHQEPTMKINLFRSASARLAVACVAIAGLVAAAIPLAADAATSTVRVDLSDNTAKPGLEGMQIAASQSRFKTGSVTFQVTNRSTALVHEMILVALDKVNARLPYDAKEDKIDEEHTRHLGEVAELDPGQGGTLQVKLAPGVYALLCNQPGHYHAGMATTITVTN